MAVIYFHTRTCNLDTCDSGCLYEQLCDEPIPETDDQLAKQWEAANDHAFRVGKQYAQLVWDKADEEVIAVGRAWKVFLGHFDEQIHHLLRNSFRDGWNLVSSRLTLLRQT